MWILAEIDKGEYWSDRDAPLTTDAILENIEDINGGYESENHSLVVKSIKEVSNGELPVQD